MGSKIRKLMGSQTHTALLSTFPHEVKRRRGGEKMPPAYPDRPPHYKNPIDRYPDASRPLSGIKIRKLTGSRSHIALLGGQPGYWGGQTGYSGRIDRVHRPGTVPGLSSLTTVIVLMRICED